MAVGKHRKKKRNKLDATVPGQEPRQHDRAVTTGPWDAEDVPDDGVERIDLGALRIPAVPGCDLRVEVSPEGHLVAATLTGPHGTMQLGAFAAPRTGGLWEEIRAELKASISSHGGTVNEQRGDFGPELFGNVPMPGGHQPARFLGVDGPRWFLRALLTGPAATHPAQAGVLEEALRNVVVDRGVDPMPVREALALRLPPGLAEQFEGGTPGTGAEQ
jgi:hypothetical protein